MSNNNSELLAEVEQYLLRKGRIYFAGWEYNKATLDEFYLDIYNLQQVYTTVPEKALAYDSCTPHHYRSFRDHFLLCSYYFNCSLEDFISVVKKHQPAGWWCSDVQLYILIQACMPKFKGWILSVPTLKLKELNNHSIKELFDAVQP